MIVKLIDKLIFAATLIVALQVPQLADHYQQFLAGNYAATQETVDGYQATADEFGYPSVTAMIEHHLQNPVPSVRADAQQKQRTLVLLAELEQGMDVFEKGYLVQKLVYMLHPSRFDYLSKTLDNFTLGIPLTLSGLSFGLIVGLLLNYIIALPLLLWARRRRMRQTQRPHHAE